MQGRLVTEPPSKFIEKEETMKQFGDRPLKVSEVAKELNLSPMTITRYLREGLLKGWRYQKVWRVDPESLRKFVQERSNRK